jgi:hypothetical protein
LLAGLQAELTRPETLDYVSAQLTTALHAIHDQRPAHRADLERAREVAQAKVRNLIAAIEEGLWLSAAILAALHTRQPELRAIEARLSALDEPVNIA